MKLQPSALLHGMSRSITTVASSRIWEERDRKTLHDLSRQLNHLARRAEHREQVVTNG